MSPPRRRSVLAAGLALLVAGCAGAPPFAPPAVPVPPRWLGQDGAAALSATWWESFGDPVLSALVAEALRSNPDLRQAAARVAEARAMARAQHAAQAPTLDFGGGATRSRSVSDVTLEPYRSTGWQGQFQAAYELDLWGRLDALDAAAGRSAEAAQAAQDAMALSMAATVASAYVGLRSLDAQLDVARRTLEARAQSLAVTQRRERQGWASALESAQAEAEWRAAAGAVPRLELAIEQQQRQLNVLLGRLPGAVERGAALLALQVPEVPVAGLPSQLLRRRPDIAGAEWQLAAADAQFEAARAQLLPSVRLGASVGRVGASVLRDDPFTVWSLGGSVLAPLFNGGRLRALRDAADARRAQALAGYERTVLGAFAEVENQLAAVDRQGRQLVEAEAQQAALERALALAARRYREGYVSYLDELLAQRSLYGAQQAVVQLHAERLQATIALYRALGGGWRRDGDPGAGG
ncbi:Outer membrane protein OprM [Xylophilus ampelinus]|nr:efflux transporter outer membrane subunit [Variovorax sp.]VTY39689.1 Outer membrane protein OprM [Xylophilus ampelinus]